jgi:hypothetical protein
MARPYFTFADIRAHQIAAGVDSDTAVAQFLARTATATHRIVRRAVAMVTRSRSSGPSRRVAAAGSSSTLSGGDSSPGSPASRAPGPPPARLASPSTSALDALPQGRWS